MEIKAYLITETLLIKNMVCSCCVKVIKDHLEKCGFIIDDIKLGKVVITFDPQKNNISEITEFLEENGMGLISDREEQVVEKIKQAVIELIHQMNNVDSMVRKSDYIVEKLGMNYQTLSKIFSKHEPVTLEKFIILHKIERIKELIDSNEFTLSEIAYMMDYSSVHYLSNQFKKITGFSVSEYKQIENKDRKPLDNIYD